MKWEEFWGIMFYMDNLRLFMQDKYENNEPHTAVQRTPLVGHWVAAITPFQQSINLYKPNKLY